MGPLPARAYRKPPDIDPLSPPEEEATYSDDEFVTVAEADPTNVPVEKVHENTRFYGKSSVFVFTSQVVNERRQKTGGSEMPDRRREFWITPDVSLVAISNILSLIHDSQWMSSILKPSPVHFEYPDMDLMQHLVNCYFDNLNIILPLLHRPSFVRSIEEGLHQVNYDFGATVLLVCAIGCRYTEDPRVVHEITTSTSCTAWKFFNQITKLKKLHYRPHSLYEAQTYPVRPLFLFPVPFNDSYESWPRSSWKGIYLPRHRG